MNVSVCEREKIGNSKRERAMNEREDASKNRKTLSDVHREMDEHFKLGNDMSSEERFLNRSFKIKRGTREFLERNLGVLFEGTEDAASQAANYCQKFLRGTPCSSITARRWIVQYTAKNAEFMVTSQPAGIIFMRRTKD